MKPLAALTTILSASLVACLPTNIAQAAEGQWVVSASGDMSSFLDCLESEQLTLISGHRGGPSAGLPENGLETMDALLTAAPVIMELDVAASTDGMLYLMHDRTVDRTTNGTGRVTDLDWQYISRLRLRDASGWVTPYSVPTLRSVLDWAKGRTILQIDFKRTAPFDDVVEMIRETGNAQNVILIAYSIEDGVKLHQLATEMMISLSVQKPGGLDDAVAAGIPADRIIAFTGTRMARPDLYDMLDKADVEVIFGTLGRSNSLDNVFDQYGLDARYAELGAMGVDVLATDRPRDAAKALQTAGRLPKSGQCGIVQSGAEAD